MLNRCARRLVALASAVFACSGAASAQTVTQTSGPDIIVCNFTDVSNSTTVTVNGIVYDQFGVGTTSANRGNTPINWFTGAGENRHPAISEGIYRYVPSMGHFEQLAVSSIKHGFEALQDNDCAAPNYFNFACIPHVDGTQLGVGCADPYCCGLNFSPGGMGPRYEINGATGLFPFPNSTTYVATSGPSRVRLTELQGAPAGTRYFEEAQYIVGDDAGVHNNNNNASWQEVIMSPAAPAPAATDFTTSLTASIHREQPAIYAWQVIDPAVTIVTFDVPNDGRFILACKVTGPVGGLYTYEYALHNLNSHRCAGSVIVPLPGTQNALTNVGFHDVEVVGEPNATPAVASANDWIVSGSGASSTSVSWAGPSYSGTPPVYTMTAVPYQVATFSQGTGNDQTANVLRWGMMFNFRFTSEIAPANTGSVAVGLWRPGTGTAFTLTNVPTPAGSVVGNLTGSCCTGTTCTVTTPAACGAGLVGLAGTTCSPNPCINGGCCLPGLTCSQLNSIDCSAQGGTYHGDGSTCASAACPTPGACCLPAGTCSQTTSTACTSASGAYSGDSTACATANCPTGACCASAGTCSLTGPTGCTATGSTYHGNGSTCATTCPIGACCIGSTQSCTSISSAGCTAQGGGYQGDNTTCTSNPCPFGACCQGCAGCVITSPSGCTGTGSNYNGNGSTCATAGCTIINGGYETGAFAPGWTQFGNTGATGIFTGAGPGGIVTPHGGTFAADFGPVGSTGGVQQIIPAHVGDMVTLGFWYALAGGGSADSFSASFAGQTLVSFTNDTGHTTWTQFTFPLTVTVDNPVLAFTFRNDPSWDYLDDVTVCIQSATAGVCCRGSTCSTSIANAPACTGSLISGQVAGASFVASGACNAAGNSTTPCCQADYNKANGITVQDIFDFLNDWFAGSPFANTGGTGVPGLLSVQNIFDFLNNWFGGGC